MLPGAPIVLLRASVPRLHDRSCANVRAALDESGAADVATRPVHVPTQEGTVQWTADKQGGTATYTNGEGRVLGHGDFVRHLTRTKVVYERLSATVLHVEGGTCTVKPAEDGFSPSFTLAVQQEDEGETWEQPPALNPESLVRTRTP